MHKKPGRKLTPPIARGATPMPTGITTRPPPPDEATVAHGARNVVVRCLGVLPRETVHILLYRASAVAPILARAVEEAGAKPILIDVEPLEAESASIGEYGAKLTPLLQGATATMLLAPVRPPAAMSVAVAKTAEAQRARHLHLLQVDERLLVTSVRADPDLLAVVNARVTSALAAPSVVRVTSEAGTALEIHLDPRHPILSSAGRPSPGTSENLPAGHVYLHPYRVSGTLVCDRAIFGPKVEIERQRLRRAPLRAVFSGGRMGTFETTDAEVRAVVDAYLASHVNANRVGLAVFPTNYLVRSEIGSDRQDMLLPGLAISMGYASAEVTRAPYEAPVQMVMLGRRQTVEVGGRRIIDAGRFDGALVDGIDPFR